MTDIELNKLSKEIIGAAIEVHRYLGPGLLENTYQKALFAELKLRGINALCEVDIPCIYKDIRLNIGYRADIIVENEIIVELKAAENDQPVFAKQLKTYLKLANKKLGLLINFNKCRLVDGVTRVVNGF